MYPTSGRCWAMDQQQMLENMCAWGEYKLEQLENYKLPIITATCDTGIYNLLSQYKFHITRRTKNYIFLRREVEPYD